MFLNLFYHKWKTKSIQGHFPDNAAYMMNNKIQKELFFSFFRKIIWKEGCSAMDMVEEGVTIK